MNEAMVYDMPQLFWYSGSWKAEMYSDYTEIYPEYTCDMETKKKRQKEIDAVVEKCLSEIKNCNGEYERIKYVFEYLVNTVEYDPSATDNQNLYSALKESILSVQVMQRQLSIFWKSRESSVFMSREQRTGEKPMRGIS